MRLWQSSMVVALALTLAGPSPAAPYPRLVEREAVIVELRPLSGTAAAPAAYRMELLPDRSTRAEVTVRWPGEAPVTVLFEGVWRPPSASAGQIVRLDSTLHLADGTVQSRSRSFPVDESVDTLLLEVGRLGEQALTFALVAHLERETVVDARPSVGAPVVFHLEILRTDGGHAVSLETNRLSTFAGEPVEYEFQLGTGGDGDMLRLELNPRRFYGDLVEVLVEVSGALPGADGPVVVSRRQTWLTNAGTASTLTVEAGEPPAGYRFVVTPRF